MDLQKSLDNILMCDNISKTFTTYVLCLDKLGGHVNSFFYSVGKLRFVKHTLGLSLREGGGCIKEHVRGGGFQVWDILKTNSQLNTIKRNHNRAAFDKKPHMFIFGCI